MDTSVELVGTDKLGRRSGPRRQYTVAEKRAIAEETLRPGASVAVVAQRHQINANLLFGWRRMLKQGLLRESATTKTAALLPVKVSTPPLLPSKRVRTIAAEDKAATSGLIEIEFGTGRLLRIRGPVDRATLSYLISALSR